MITDPAFYVIATFAVLLTGISKGGFAGAFGGMAGGWRLKAYWAKAARSRRYCQRRVYCAPGKTAESRFRQTFQFSECSLFCAVDGLLYFSAVRPMRSRSITSAPS